ncbi:MAG: hypothetical protein K5639_03180 [Eubacterium sp.]|nr:hypothetical protein [Eubacterium sp.]
MAKADKDNSVTEDAGKGGGSKAVTIIIVLVIVLIWLAGFAVLIKLDVGGFGSGVMYPVLKDVPVLNKILPEPEEPETTSKYYDNLDEANAKIRELEEKIANKSKSNSGNTSEIDKLRAENARLKKYEADQAQFATRVYDFDSQVVFGDKAPDTEEYYNYYSELNKDRAEQLMKKVAKKFNYSQKIIDQADTFAKMQPAQAAAALTEMSGDLDLVAKILDSMQASKAALILDQIEPTVMAQIVTKMTNMKK